MRVSTDGNGNTNITNPSTGEQYPTSNGPPNSSYSDYLSNSGSGGSNGYGSGGGNSFDVTFNNDYYSSNYDNNYQPSQESINREMIPVRDRAKASAESSTVEQKGEIDWIEVSLGGVSSGAALVALGAPHPAVKFGAAFVGTVSTLGSVGYSVYQYNEGRKSRNELFVQIALDVTPMFGKAIARKTAAVAIDVLEHQIGLGQGLKSIFYDPNRKE